MWPGRSAGTRGRSRSGELVVGRGSDPLDKPGTSNGSALTVPAVPSANVVVAVSAVASGNTMSRRARSPAPVPSTARPTPTPVSATAPAPVVHRMNARRPCGGSSGLAAISVPEETSAVGVADARALLSSTRRVAMPRPAATRAQNQPAMKDDCGLRAAAIRRGGRRQRTRPRRRTAPAPARRGVRRARTQRS